MTSLKEVKEELREELREIKSALYSLREECSGIDKHSGHYSQTGKYEMRMGLEQQYETTKRFLDMLVKVRRLR